MNAILTVPYWRQVRGAASHMGQQDHLSPLALNPGTHNEVRIRIGVVECPKRSFYSFLSFCLPIFLKTKFTLIG